MLGACLLVFTGGAQADGSGPAGAGLEVTNPTGMLRPEEVLEVPLAAIRARLEGTNPANLVVEDSATHRSLPVQLDSSTPGAAADRLLVLVGLSPHETVRLVIHAAAQHGTTSPMVFGRVVPERKDDFAWENDKVAYRVYGPALQATGEITSGIDVWSKRVPDLIVNTWYSRDAEGQRTDNPALSYHKDSGQGLDSYEVGLSRGCGGTGVWTDGKLFVSKNYVSAEILAEGPIRFRFRLRYTPWEAEGIEVSEEKVITLDAGSHLNRIESTLSISGTSTSGKQPPEWVAGLAMHSDAHVNKAEKAGIVSVWEPLTNAAAGMDGTAIVLEPGESAETIEASGNVMVMRPATPGASMTYYSGAAWSKADIPDEAAWNRYLEAFRKRLHSPLKTRWE
jgi:hypothetical protein